MSTQYLKIQTEHEKLELQTASSADLKCGG